MTSHEFFPMWISPLNNILTYLLSMWVCPLKVKWQFKILIVRTSKIKNRFFSSWSEKCVIRNTFLYDVRFFFKIHSFYGSDPQTELGMWKPRKRYDFVRIKSRCGLNSLHMFCWKKVIYNKGNSPQVCHSTSVSSKLSDSSLSVTLEKKTKDKAQW